MRKLTYTGKPFSGIVLPKANTLFTFTTGGANGKVYTLYGNQFRTRPGERAAKKFKDKPSVDLP